MSPRHGQHVVKLSPAAMRRLDEEAERRGTSASDVLDRAIDAYLTKVEEGRRGILLPPRTQQLARNSYLLEQATPDRLRAAARHGFQINDLIRAAVFDQFGVS